MNSILRRNNWIRTGLLTLATCLVSVGLGILVGSSLKLVVFALVFGAIVMLLYIASPSWMIAISLAISPLLDQTANHSLPGIGFDLASVVRGASVIGMLLTMRNVAGRKSESNTLLIWSSLALILALCISLPLAYNPLLSMKQTLALAYWVVFTIYIYRKLQTTNDARIIIGGLFAAAVVIIVTMAPYEIHQTYGTYTDGSTSIYGPYSGGPFNLALSIAYWTPLFFVLRTRWQKVIYGLLMLALLYILLHTFVRTSLVVLLIFLLYTVIGNKRYRRVGIGAIVLIAATMTLNNVQSGWMQRMNQAHTLNGLSSGRIELYTVAVQRFIDLSPIRKVVGIGFGNAPVLMVSHGQAFNTDPQNDFLNTLLSAGVLGLIGLIVYLVASFREIRVIQNKHQRGTATVVFLSILFTAIINGIYSGETTAMVFSISTMGLARFYGMHAENQLTSTESGG